MMPNTSPVFFVATLLTYSSLAISGGTELPAAPVSEIASNPGQPASESMPFKPIEDKNDGFSQSAIRLAQVAAKSPLKATAAELTQAATSAVETGLKSYFPTVELNMRWASNNQPVFGALVVKPLYKSEDALEAVFNQSSIYYVDGRTTLNLGLGYRRLVADETVIVGTNAFYDHEFPYAHARASVGGELRSSVAELNANFYNNVSGWRSGRNGQQEKAMGGFDVEVGVAAPYLPQVKGYARQFQWKSVDGAADLKGSSYSLKGNLFPGFSLEVGRDFYAGAARPTSTFLMWHLDIVKMFNPPANSVPFFASKAYELKSMREHMYEKVRRENIIQKQARGFVITASGR
jgi:adhesin/invasin